MDKWEEINQRLENAMMVTSRIPERHAADLKDHREWLEDLTRAAVQHERSMEEHRLRMEAIDERLEQITIKLDRIAELIFRDRSSNGHES
jgi:hypothetical protein